VNDTKVFPARLIGEWPDTHGAIELLMVNAAPMDADDERPSMTAGTDSLRWNCIIGSGRKCREGQVASFGQKGELKATLVKPLSGIGMWQVEFSCDRPLMDLLDEFGRTPVPPYVKREGTAEEEKEDRERYQTIYAREVGSVAAPTAGLHFTPEIFAALDAKGVKRVAVTLHVGPGTFRPVKADNIEDHHMDFEAFTVPPETAEAINECKARGGRVFCVGSTTVRTLETVAAAVDGQNGRVVEAGSGASDIFIYPPYRFRVCDCMLTNFHLPQSTLLMMISALAGRERVLCSYALAVRNNYMFFSYGDCMLIV
jgi:S-adenosylmethionine:tRNA ribosyltransferase-isomerase